MQNFIIHSLREVRRGLELERGTAVSRYHAPAASRLSGFGNNKTGGSKGYRRCSVRRLNVFAPQTDSHVALVSNMRTF